MNKNAVLPVLVIMLAGLFGCTPPARGPNDADHDKEPDDPRLESPAIIEAASRVKVLPGKLACQSEVLGIVDVHEPVASVADGLEKLRRRAALLGADAVTGVELEHGEGGADKTHLSGTAVRCNDLLRGRRYDVLAHLEASGAMDHEDEVFDDFKRQALAKGANLILDVRFEHGEGDRTKIMGTAVRAY